MPFWMQCHQFIWKSILMVCVCVCVRVQSVACAVLCAAYVFPNQSIDCNIWTHFMYTNKFLMIFEWVVAGLHGVWCVDNSNGKYGEFGRYQHQQLNIKKITVIVVYKASSNIRRFFHRIFCLALRYWELHYYYYDYFKFEHSIFIFEEIR